MSVSAVALLTSTARQLPAILEGAFGLGIVVFIFTPSPRLLVGHPSEEEKVAWLYGRTGANPTISSLLEWCHTADESDDPTATWNDCERWFTDIRETHGMTPLLALSCRTTGHGCCRRKGRARRTKGGRGLWLTACQPNRSKSA